MLWYRATDKWRTELLAKPGTKWHLVDLARSDNTTVLAACDAPGHWPEQADRVLYEQPTRLKRGELIPTPGRGAICKRCYTRVLPAA